MPKLPSVYKRPRSPIYWGSVVIKGKRKQFGLCENKAAAQRMLADIKERLKGQNKYGATTWTAFKKRYLEWAKANKSPQTAYRDGLAFDYLEKFKHLKSLNEIDLTFAEDFKTWLKNTSNKLAETYTPKKEKRPVGLMGDEAINRVLQSFKVICRKAAEWELMPELKLSRVKKFKTPRGRVEFFTPQEVRILLDFADKKAEGHGGYCPYKTAVMLGARAGLRRGEMVHLEWVDINFDRQILTVQPKHGWTPKTNECRDVSLPPDLISFLRALPRSKKCNNVLYDYYGDPFTLDGLAVKFGKFVRTSGLKGGLHKLRHTFASHLVQNGVDLYTVSKLLGHSSIKTTEIYAHLSPVTLAGAVAKLPQI